MHNLESASPFLVNLRQLNFLMDISGGADPGFPRGAPTQMEGYQPFSQPNIPKTA